MMEKPVRPSQVELYQIDENQFGELLIAVPNLGQATKSAEFDVHKGDCVLYFDDGEMVRLLTIPSGVLPKVTAARKMVIAEFEDGRFPIRAYKCGRVGR